jgi:thiamine-phosphate pyrophosphorylase
MKHLEDCRLYGILDMSYVRPSDIVHVAAEMLEGGVDIIQLRAKAFIPDDVKWFAEQIHPVTSAAGVPFVINDFPEVASGVGAEGVHIGQDDVDVEQARELAGYRTVIGKSTHTVEQIVAASAEDTDYLGFGPIFATPTKADYPPIGLTDIRKAYELSKKPIFCIGGIKLENLPTLLEAGARRVAIVSGILQADDITGYCRKVKELLAGA